MEYKDDELHLGARCFDVEADLSGAEWENADQSVGIMTGGFCGVSIDSLTAWELNEDGERIGEVTDQDTLKLIREAVQEQASGDANFMDKLSEAQEDRLWEEWASRGEREY